MSRLGFLPTKCLGAHELAASQCRGISSLKRGEYANKCGIGVTVVTADGSKRVERVAHTEGSTSVVAATCTTPEGTAHICKFCSATISIDETSPALGHSFTVLTGIVYARFDADGYKVHKCVRCTETDSSEIAPAIFIHRGYSYKEDGSKSGVYTEFYINSIALSEYESVNVTTVSFGIAIFNPTYLNDGENFFDGTNVDADKGVVQVDLNENSRKYSRLYCLISGFDKANEKHTSLELVIAGFAYEADGDVQIMQKQYEVKENEDVFSPYLSKVTKNDAVLYTVSIVTVEDMPLYTGSIKDFGTV